MLKDAKYTYLNLRLTSLHNQMLAIIASEDFRNKQNSLLVLIQEEFHRRHPDGAPLVEKQNCAEQD